MSYRHSMTPVRWPALALALGATCLVALFALILSGAAPELLNSDAGIAAALWVVSIVALIRMAARRPDPLRPLPALVAGGSFILGLALLAVSLLNSLGA